MAQNEGVFDKVKRTFLRMASFEADAPKIDPLVSMNYPPTMGRRDAAYDRASKLLRDNIFTRSDRERNKIYIDVLKLLDIAIDNTASLLAPLKKGAKSIEREQMLNYLKMLRNAVASAQSVVEQQQMLVSSEREMSGFLGSQSIDQFHSAGEIFSDSEMNIYHSVVELIECAESAILRYREQSKRPFEKAEADRYAKSLCESEIIYSKYGNHQ